MNVACDRWIGPDFQFGPVRAYPRQRQRDGNIQIRRKSFCRLPRRTIEYPERLGNSLDIDVVLDDVRRAGEPGDRLPRYHPNRMDGPDRRRGDGVEANQRTRGYHDLAAISLGKLDEILVVEQRARAKNHRDLSAGYERFDDRSDELARGALDDDIRDVAERVDRQDRGRSRQTGKPASVLLGMLYRHSDKSQSVHSPVQRFRYPFSD